MGFSPDAGERVIYEGNPSWRSIIPFYLKGIGAAVLIALVLRLAGTGPFDLFLVIVIVIGATVLAGLVKRAATVYTVTDRRLHLSRGVLAKEVEETRLDRVQHVSWTQSPVERLLGIGEVDFDTASGSDGSLFVFSGVANPGGVVESVRRGASWGAGAGSL
ncbi:MAG: PH domain-containing protein [Solirubrobacterales bacterium]